MSQNPQPSGAQKKKALNICLVKLNELSSSMNKVCSLKTTHSNAGN